MSDEPTKVSKQIDTTLNDIVQLGCHVHFLFKVNDKLQVDHHKQNPNTSIEDIESNCNLVIRALQQVPLLVKKFRIISLDRATKIFQIISCSPWFYATLFRLLKTNAALVMLRLKFVILETLSNTQLFESEGKYSMKILMVFCIKFPNSSG